MFLADEEAIIDQIIREDGLTEDDCLAGLTEQQRKVWVRYAILGETISQIKDEVFCNRKYSTDSMVQYTLADAQLRIVANILQDADLMCLGKHRPGMRLKIQQLIRKVQLLKRQKGLKKPCLL